MTCSDAPLKTDALTQLEQLREKLLQLSKTPKQSEATQDTMAATTTIPPMITMSSCSSMVTSPVANVRVDCAMNESMDSVAEESVLNAFQLLWNAIVLYR